MWTDTDASIIGTPHFNACGDWEYNEYEWQGGNVALLSYFTVRRGQSEDLRRGQATTLGALRLRVVSGRLDYADGVLVMRDGWKARVWAHVYPLARWLGVVRSRLIWTAGVWGLADVRPGAILRWRDIHIVKRLTEAFGRAR